MLITIEYDSIWQNSFLAGDDGKPISRENKRKFKATSKAKDHDVRVISESTVLGVLCRLIGDQRKLYQIKESAGYYFRDIENRISHEIRSEQISKETAFIINKSDKRPAQTTFLGVIPDATDLFFSDSAPQLWSIIYLSLNELMDFILSDSAYEKTGSSLPRDILFRVDEISNVKTETGRPVKTIAREVGELNEKISKEKDKLAKRREKFEVIASPTERQKKAFEGSVETFSRNIKELQDDINKIQNSKKRIEFEKKLKAVVTLLDKKFSDKKDPDKSYLENENIYRMRLYAAALYIQAERMDRQKMPVDYCFNRKGEISIQGFSKRGFNSIRDFLNRLAGSKTKTVGTPFPLTKTSGQLEITIDVDRDKAKEIRNLIENAGVSSFYLGKKGLAYVKSIDTREVRH